MKSQSFTARIGGRDYTLSAQDDPERLYGMTFAGREVRFRVKDGLATVLEITVKK